jgi:hypothetical protein
MMKRRTPPTLSPEEAALLIQNGAIFAAGGLTHRAPDSAARTGPTRPAIASGRQGVSGKAPQRGIDWRTL